MIYPQPLDRTKRRFFDSIVTKQVRFMEDWRSKDIEIVGNRVHRESRQNQQGNLTLDSFLE